jgi:mannose-6-phosphate isomerase-like protein (cupin superfamily)
MLDSNPQLTFSATKQLGEGISVHSMDFKKERLPFQATYFDVLPGQSTPPDIHAESELWIVLEGRGHLCFEGQIYPLEQKDSFYFPSYTQHQVHNHSDDLLIICSIFW